MHLDYLRSKASLQQQIHDITRIPLSALEGAPLSSFTVEERFSWMRGRYTTRPEDMAYCLMGVFEVHMPLLYGEGKPNALWRLKEEVEKVTPDQIPLNSQKFTGRPRGQDPQGFQDPHGPNGALVVRDRVRAHPRVAAPGDLCERL